MNVTYAKFYGPDSFSDSCQVCQSDMVDIGPLCGPEAIGMGKPLRERFGPESGLPLIVQRDLAWAKHEYEGREG